MVKAHWFLSFTTQRLSVDGSHDARPLPSRSVADASLCAALSQPGPLLTRTHPRKKATHREMRRKGGGVMNSSACIPDNWEAECQGGVTCGWVVEQLLTIWVISVETSEVSLFLCQNAYVSIKRFLLLQARIADNLASRSKRVLRIFINNLDCGDRLQSQLVLPGWISILSNLLRDLDRKVIQWENMKPPASFSWVDVDVWGTYNSFQKVSALNTLQYL